MVRWCFSYPRRPQMLLVAILTFTTCTVGAKTLSIENILLDFQFDGASVDYNPAPDKVFVTFDNPRATLSTTDASAEPETYQGTNVLHSALFLSEKAAGDLLRVSFNTFGSLPSMDGQSLTDLAQTSADAMGSRSLQFIIDAAPIPGSLASRFRDAGIFATAAGISVEDWVRPYTDPHAAKGSFLSAELGETARDSAATPVPSTVLLFLAAGLSRLALRRRT